MPWACSWVALTWECQTSLSSYSFLGPILYIKIVVIYEYSKALEIFPSKYFQPSLIFAGKAGAHLSAFLLLGKLLTLLANIRQGCKCLTMDIHSSLLQTWAVFTTLYVLRNLRIRPIS